MNRRRMRYDSPSAHHRDVPIRRHRSSDAEDDQRRDDGLCPRRERIRPLVCRQQQADGGNFKLYYVTTDIASTPDSTLLLQQAESGSQITQAPCTGPASSSEVV